MFSTASIHPSMHPYIIRRVSPMPLRKSSSRLSPTSPFIGNSNTRELFLLSMLQGTSTTCCERVRMAEEISLLNIDEKRELVDFLNGSYGAASCAVENNACKRFSCTASQLSEAFHDESCADKLVHLWDQLYKDIIPAMESILFPLKDCDPDFDIRRVVLRFFRDRVLKRCLEPVDCRVPEIESILFTILVETAADDSTEFDIFAEIANRLMGAPEAEEDFPPFSSFRRSSTQSDIIKSRSKTLPNKRKSVQWQDLRKSKTVSQF